MNESEYIDLKKYKKMTKIGKGGNAKVYKVKEISTGAIVAAKISTKHVLPDKLKSILPIAREVNINSKMNHPCIAKFYGYSPVDFNDKPFPTIIIEYFSNGSLSHILEIERNGHPLSEWSMTKKLAVIYGIASGMHYLHSNKILHRDLKTENILLDEFLCPKIADFGLSKQGGDVINSTANRFKGTFAYAAPETFENSINIEASDVYSFAFIVFEIMTGQNTSKKFDKMNSYQVGHLVVNGYRPNFEKEIPESYQKLIQDCWEMKPENRPSFEEILKRLVEDDGFITDEINKDDYFKYIEFIEKSQIEFNDKKELISLENFIEKEKMSFQKVEIIKDIFYDEDELNSLLESCQQLVLEAANDSEKQFFLATLIFDGKNGFPQNSILATKYIESSIEKENEEAAIYFAKLLIKGDKVKQNLKKAELILRSFIEKRNPMVLTLYGQLKKRNEEYQDAVKYFKKASSLNYPEAMFEYGLLLGEGKGTKKNVKQANNLIKKAQENGFNDFESLPVFKDDDDNAKNCDSKGKYRFQIRRDEAEPEIRRIKIKVPKRKQRNTIGPSFNININDESATSDTEKEVKKVFKSDGNKGLLISKRCKSDSDDGDGGKDKDFSIVITSTDYEDTISDSSDIDYSFSSDTSDDDDDDEKSNSSKKVENSDVDDKKDENSDDDKKDENSDDDKKDENSDDDKKDEKSDDDVKIDKDEKIKIVEEEKNDDVEKKRKNKRSSIRRYKPVVSKI